MPLNKPQKLTLGKRGLQIPLVALRLGRSLPAAFGVMRGPRYLKQTHLGRPYAKNMRCARRRLRPHHVRSERRATLPKQAGKEFTRAIQKEIQVWRKVATI